MDRFPLEDLAVEADHAVVLRVEHAGQPDEEHLEDSGFQKGHLVVLAEQAESRYAFGELDDSADGGRESFREILKELLLASQRLWVRIQRTARLQQKRRVPSVKFENSEIEKYSSG